MEIGDRIKYYRNKLKISQEELANKCGLSRNAIYNYEKGKRRPDFLVLDDIAQALECNLIDLVGLQNEDHKTSSNNYSLEHYLGTLGYEIIAEEENGYLILKAAEGQYEITMDDLNELTSSTESFIRFKISEIIKHSRKLGK